MDISAFLGELRRRRVFRALAWYAGIAWILVQAASIFQPGLGLPAWTVRATVVLVLVGLPVVALLAWAFDLQRDGAPVPGSHWRIPSPWLALTAGVLLVLGSYQAWQVGSQTSSIQPVTIAVLPFEALDESRERTLADGLHASVLHDLASLPQLAVVPRRRTLATLAQTRDTAELARALGARYLLEGDVQWLDAEVLLRLRLRDPNRAQPLWQHSYRRAVRETFLLQRQLAAEIAQALSLAVPPAGDRKARAVDAAAVELYLQAWALDGSERTGREAVDLLSEATRVDPGFALAWAWLAEEHADYATRSPYADERYLEHLPLAKAALARAEALDPDLAHAADARMHIAWAEDDPQAALRAGRRLVELLPGDPSKYSHLLSALAGAGQWSAADELAQQATSRFPNEVTAWLWHANLRFSAGDYRAAAASHAQAARLGADITSREAWLRLCERGDPHALARIAEAGGHPGERAVWAYTLGDVERALAISSEWYAREGLGEPLRGAGIFHADFLWMTGEQEAARAIYRQLLMRLATQDPAALQPYIRTFHHGALAIIHHRLGNAEPAESHLRAMADNLRGNRDADDSTNERRGYGQQMLSMDRPDEAAEVLDHAFRSRTTNRVNCPWATWMFPITTPHREHPALRAMFRRHGVDVDRPLPTRA